MRASGTLGEPQGLHRMGLGVWGKAGLHIRPWGPPKYAWRAVLTKQICPGPKDKVPQLPLLTACSLLQSNLSASCCPWPASPRRPPLRGTEVPSTCPFSCISCRSLCATPPRPAQGPNVMTQPLSQQPDGCISPGVQAGSSGNLPRCVCGVSSFFPLLPLTSLVHKLGTR